MLLNVIGNETANTLNCNPICTWVGSTLRVIHVRKALRSYTLICQIAGLSVVIIIDGMLITIYAKTCSPAGDVSCRNLGQLERQ